MSVGNRGAGKPGADRRVVRTMEGGNMRTHLDEFQVYLLRSGVKVTTLLKDDPWLQLTPPTPEACHACRKLMLLVKLGRSGGVPPEEIDAFFALRDAARRRREKHLSNVRSVVELLANVKQFQRHHNIVVGIASFLGAPGILPDTGLECLCTAGGCRARSNGIMAFLAHIQAKHL